MIRRTLAGLTLLILSAGPSWSQHAMPIGMPDESITAWSACRAQVNALGEGWLGWRRDFGNGYGDSFAFYDGRFDGQASMLVTTRAVDGIAMEETSWCYRANGSLALIATRMNAPLLDASGSESPNAASRVGWIALTKSAAILATKGWVERDGHPNGDVNDPALQLARGCDQVALYLRVDDVQLQMESVLGDIEGNRPELEPPLLYDWCGALAAAD